MEHTNKYRHWKSLLHVNTSAKTLIDVTVIFWNPRHLAFELVLLLAKFQLHIGISCGLLNCLVSDSSKFSPSHLLLIILVHQIDNIRRFRFKPRLVVESVTKMVNLLLSCRGEESLKKNVLIQMVIQITTKIQTIAPLAISNLFI